MVCHWSRTRPELSVNGHWPLSIAGASAGFTATRLARAFGVKKPPLANSRFVPLERFLTGHCSGLSASYAA